MRLLGRLCSYALVVWSIVLAGIDGTASILAGALRYTTLAGALERMNGADALVRLRATVSSGLHPLFWDGMIVPLLPAPFGLLLAFLALALWIAARDRRPDFALTGTV